MYIHINNDDNSNGDNINGDDNKNNNDDNNKLILVSKIPSY